MKGEMRSNVLDIVERILARATPETQMTTVVVRLARGIAKAVDARFNELEREQKKKHEGCKKK